MSGLGYRHPLVERVYYHRDRIRAWARRVTPGGLSVRVVIWFAGTAALVLASPPSLQSAVVPLAAVVALLPAGFPRTRMVSLVELMAIAALAVNLELWTGLVVGGLLYLHHTAAALGAQLRTDTVIPAAVLRHWASRAGLVLAGSAGLSLAIVGLAQEAPSGWATAYLALGAAAAVAIAGYLAYAAQRPTE